MKIFSLLIAVAVLLGLNYLLFMALIEGYFFGAALLAILITVIIYYISTWYSNKDKYDNDLYERPE
jgi:hypothetical protein